MDSLINDIRYALRTLLKHPAFTTVSILTLALGIGANTAIFSVVDAVLLRPLPYRDAGQLVTVWTHQTDRPDDRNPASLPEALDYREQNTTLSGLAAFAFNRYEVNGPEGTDMARAAMATGDLFSVLGTAPMIGRTPGPAEDREPVIVLSHRLWMQRYDGDRSVIGRSVNLYDKPYTIIGVMPPGFHFPTPDIDLWASLYPIYSSPAGSGPDWVRTRSLHGYRLVARLKPGVSLAAAEADLNAVQRRLAVTYPNEDAGLGIALTSLRAQTVGGVQQALWLLLGAAGLVLLIACANIAHLLLARTTTRAREIAVRQALGAQRWRLARQMITESLVLGAVGGTAGILVAVWGTAALVQLAPADIPRLETVAVNGWVLLFAAVASLGAGALFGLAPAWQAWRDDFAPVLGTAARGVGAGSQGGTFRRALMAAEVAVALVLLMGTGLMLKSFGMLLRTDPGFPVDHLLTFHVILQSPTAQGQTQSAEAVVARLSTVAGISSVGAATSLPPTMIQQSSGFSVDGRPAPAPGHAPTALFVPATPGYLRTLNPAFVSGRDFSSADRADGAPVTIVSQAFAQEFFPNENALGHRITESGVSREIIGVVGDMKFFGLGTPAGPTMYVPFSQRPFGGVWVALRTTVEPMSLVETVRGALHEISPGMNPRTPATMETLLGASVVQPRFQASLLGLFGAIALVLAAVGVYGVISYGVAQRTGEIGVRLALGASSPNVLGLIVRQGMAPVAVGLAMGLAGSFALTRLLGRLLYQVKPTDPLTFAAVTVVLAGVALLAAYVPARRAARVDPMTALRHD